MIIQHNIAAANAYRNMKSNRSGLSRNLEKLSSGYRINRSADDAAGLAISEEMRAKINGLNQAAMNVDDGIGLIQTADGAMTEIHAMLERGVTLTTQAANGTYNDVSRDAIQKELDELGNEIDRIYESADFNGVKVLQGLHESPKNGYVEELGSMPDGVVFDSATAAEGWMAAIQIDPTSVPVDVTYTYTDSYGQMQTATVTANVRERLSSAEVDFSNYVTGATGAFHFNCPDCGTHYSINLVSGTGVSIEESGWKEIDGYSYEDGFYKRSQGPGDHDYIVFNIGVDNVTKDDIASKIEAVVSDYNTTNDFGSMDELGFYVRDLKLIIHPVMCTITNYSDVVDDINDSSLNPSLTNLNLSETSITSAVRQANNDHYAWVYQRDRGGYGELRKKGNVDEGLVRWKALMEGEPDVMLQIGPTEKETMDVRLPYVCTEGLKINNVKVDTVAKASQAMESYQKAIDQLSLERARLGAYENRLEHTRNYLGIASENTTAAESRIRDTDMAKEMAAYTKNNILAQAAQSMLAQANQSGQGVLSLLQG